MSSYGYKTREDPPNRLVPAGDPEPRIGAPTSGEARAVQRLPGSGHLSEASAGILRSEDGRFEINLDEEIIRIVDTSDQERVLAGLLDSDLDSYGIEIRNAAGLLVLGADGLGVEIVGSAQIENGAITEPKIGAQAVTETKLFPGAVTTTKIAADSVTETLLADGAVTSVKVQDDAITETKLSSGAVTTTKIAEGAVTEVTLAPGSITTTKIADGQVTTTKVANSAITAAQIFAGTITAAEIAAGTITAAEIAAGTITAANIAAGTITAAEIAADTITAGEIAASTITGDLIAANTIAGANILAGTIQTENLAANAITAAKIAAGTITADEISAGTITGDRIAAGTIAASNIIAGTITANEISGNNVSALFADLGVITAGIARDANSRFITNYNNAILEVFDENAQVRGRFGKIGAGATDYGLQVLDAAGTIILNADGLGIDVVGTTQLQNLSITSGKIDGLAVTTPKINTGAITTGKLDSLAVTEAKIGTAAISTAKIQDLAVSDAKIASLTAAKITAGAIGVAHFIQSTGYTAGSAGWKIDGDGDAEFNNVTVRGTLDGATGTFSGNIESTSIFIRNANWPNTDDGMLTINALAGQANPNLQFQRYTGTATETMAEVIGGKTSFSIRHLTKVSIYAGSGGNIHGMELTNPTSLVRLAFTQLAEMTSPGEFRLYPSGLSTALSDNQALSVADPTGIEGRASIGIRVYLGGARSSRLVNVGDADSGGTGWRMLRVLN